MGLLAEKVTVTTNVPCTIVIWNLISAAGVTSFTANIPYGTYYRAYAVPTNTGVGGYDNSYTEYYTAGQTNRDILLTCPEHVPTIYVSFRAESRSGNKINVYAVIDSEPSSFTSFTLHATIGYQVWKNGSVEDYEYDREVSETVRSSDNEVYLFTFYTTVPLTGSGIGDWTDVFYDTNDYTVYYTSDGYPIYYDTDGTRFE